MPIEFGGPEFDPIGATPGSERSGRPESSLDDGPGQAKLGRVRRGRGEDDAADRPFGPVGRRATIGRLEVGRGGLHDRRKARWSGLAHWLTAARIASRSVLWSS